MGAIEDKILRSNKRLFGRGLSASIKGLKFCPQKVENVFRLKEI